MSDHFIRDDKGQCHTIITMANIYTYNGFIFEFHGYCGPMKLKKNWEPAAREGRKFWKTIDAWCKLTKEEKESTRLSG
jgi:multimeric flavodoxin WrbA